MNELDDLFASARSNPEGFGAVDPDPELATRIDENLLVVQAALDAPRESLLARALRRLGVPDLAVPLITATPALRRSWFVAIAIAVLFAVSASSNEARDAVERIAIFLTLAPLVPLLGVALAFGRGVDPTHDIVVAAPRDTFRVFLIRAATVLVASSVLLLAGSAFLPAGGWFRVAWLLPALMLTVVTMALSAGRDARIVAGAVAGAWIVAVIVVTQVASSSAMFGLITQAIALALGVAGLLVLLRRRPSVEITGVRA